MTLQGFEEWKRENHLKDLESELRVTRELLKVKGNALTRMTMLAVAGWITVLITLILLVNR